MILRTMKRITICFIPIVLLSVILNSCSKAPSALEQDLTDTLSVLCNTSSDKSSYIYGEPLQCKSNNSHVGDGDVTEKIASLVTFKIVDILEEPDTATAKVKLVSPDVYQMITEITSELQEYSVVTLLSTLEDNLDGDYAVKEYEVTVTLKLINEHWYLVPNGELANAFSGGIIEKYSTMGQEVINRLVEEGETDG